MGTYDFMINFSIVI